MLPCNLRLWFMYFFNIAFPISCMQQKNFAIKICLHTKNIRVFIQCCTGRTITNNNKFRLNIKV